MNIAKSEKPDNYVDIERQRRLSLSVIIPAYNEAPNILNTLNNVVAALNGLNYFYEIIVIDDGSSDETATIVENNIKNFPEVVLLRNGRNRGFGYSYNRGVQNAKMNYSVMVHGDNAWGSLTLNEFFSHLGEADVIIGYTKNMWQSRHWTRTVISKSFTYFLNILLNKRLKYYNGLQIHRSNVLKKMNIRSKGYSFQAEVLVKGLFDAESFIEVGMDLMERELGVTKAFRLKNIIEVLSTVLYLKKINNGRAAY